MTDNKPAPKVGYVDARIFGKAIRFELVRDPRTFGMIEEHCGPFSALWQRFQRAQHSTKDVRIILSAAHPYIEPQKDSAYSRLASISAMLRDEPEAADPINGAPVQVIDTLMKRMPFGGWEELAAVILAACISGLDPLQATFTYPPPAAADPVQVAAE